MFKIWFNIRFGYGIHGLFYKKTESDLAMVLVILSSIQNFGPHLVGIGFYVSKSAKCVHTILQYSLTKKKREREMMYVRAYVCKKGSLCIYSGKNENCANY